MRKLLKSAKAWVGGLGILGIVGLLTWLFGDNIIPRAYQSLFPAEQGAEEQPPARPSAVSPELQPTEPEPETSTQPHFPLLDRLCRAGRMTLTFPVHDKDPPRFKRRAGTQIVEVPDCFRENATFRTRAENDSTWDRDGIVAGNRLQFRYRYTDSQGIVDCRVVAEVKGSTTSGRISCETMGGEAMDTRKVDVEISDN